MIDTINREDVMTDFQFRAIMTMVLGIMENDNYSEAKKIISQLAAGKLPAVIPEPVTKKKPTAKKPENSDNKKAK